MLIVCAFLFSRGTDGCDGQTGKTRNAALAAIFAEKLWGKMLTDSWSGNQRCVWSVDMRCAAVDLRRCDTLGSAEADITASTHRPSATSITGRPARPFLYIINGRYYFHDFDWLAAMIMTVAARWRAKYLFLANLRRLFRLHSEVLPATGRRCCQQFVPDR